MDIFSFCWIIWNSNSSTNYSIFNHRYMNFPMIPSIILYFFRVFFISLVTSPISTVSTTTSSSTSICCSQIEVTFASHVESKQGIRAGTYIHGGKINGYDYWIDDDNSHAIWYYPAYKDWAIGAKDKLGTNIRGLTTVGDFNENEGNCPTGNHTWKFVYNGEWIETNDVFVECSMPSSASDTGAVSEFLYYKNNVWAHEKTRQPHDSPLMELIYYKNNVWSKTDFLKHSTSKNTTTPPQMKDITVEKGQSEVKHTLGFNTSSFFEGIICIVVLYIVGYAAYKVYLDRKLRKSNKSKQFSNPLSCHNNLETPSAVKSQPSVKLTSNGEVSILT